MHNNRVFGSYVPSYILIKLIVDEPFDHIKKLGKENQRLFVHEYTHFLQNLTGGFGHAHIWNTYDRLRQVIHDQQNNGLDEMKIPINNQVVKDQLVYFKTLRTIEGSYKLRDGMHDPTTIVQNLKMFEDENFKILYSDKKNPFLILHVDDKYTRKDEYVFGEAAVSETMAYLMESKFFGKLPTDNYPYEACQRLGEYLKSDIIKNDEWVFALCDVALLSHYPGRMFYQVLLDMHQKKFVPKQSEDIIDFGLHWMYSNGWHIWEDFEESKNGAIKVLNDLFNDPVFKETADWLKYILESGFQARRSNPYFMIQLFRERQVFEGFWDKIMAEFGTPHLDIIQKQNSDEEYPLRKRYFNPPVELIGIGKKIEPIFLLSLQQINNTLIKGSSKCGLYGYCKFSQNGLKVDNRCLTAPWRRADDEGKCAYAALLAKYGLNAKKVLAI